MQDSQRKNGGEICAFVSRVEFGWMCACVRVGTDGLAGVRVCVCVCVCVYGKHSQVLAEYLQ